MARIAIVGAGYTGLSTAIALALAGHQVECVDVDRSKVQSITAGRAPFYERGVGRAVASLRKRGRLTATENAAAAVEGATMVFLCVGTPSRPDGSFDPSFLLAASEAVGRGLRASGRKTIVVKSTVIPGTTEQIVIPTVESVSGRERTDFGVCVCPEFLREGHALRDSVHPSHIVIGEMDRASGDTLFRLYRPVRCPKLRTSLRAAEMIKYAANAFLAAKVTFANEIANLCTRLELDSDEVLGGMSLDPRISPHHLQPGVGFGGSCLPKDLRALTALARKHQYEPAFLSAVLEENERQPFEVIRLLKEEVGDLRGKRIAILGLAFKAGTSDLRESRAIPLARELLRQGAIVTGYDPVAGNEFSSLVPEISIEDSMESALQQAEACIVQAAWPEFSRLHRNSFRRDTVPVVVDCRRLWTRARIPKGIRYRRVG